MIEACGFFSVDGAAYLPFPTDGIPVSLCKGHGAVFVEIIYPTSGKEFSEMSECKGCHGTGKCSKCHGKGGKEGMFTKSVCAKCGGSGNCTVCKGRGRT